jgi:hypothetical protein
MLQPFVGDATKDGCEQHNLLPGVLFRRIVHGVAHTVSQIHNHLPVHIGAANGSYTKPSFSLQPAPLYLRELPSQARLPVQATLDNAHGVCGAPSYRYPDNPLTAYGAARDEAFLRTELSLYPLLDVCDQNSTSALSIFNFRVEGLEFSACVVDFELPIDPALLLVDGH